MSLSGAVMLNGCGTAESFAIGCNDSDSSGSTHSVVAMANGQDRSNGVVDVGGIGDGRGNGGQVVGLYDDDSWEPEDLVATVQFLATLDNRLPPYVDVLPGDQLTSTSNIQQQQQQQQQHHDEEHNSSSSSPPSPPSSSPALFLTSDVTVAVKKPKEELLIDDRSNATDAHREYETKSDHDNSPVNSVITSALAPALVPVTSSSSVRPPEDEAEDQHRLFDAATFTTTTTTAIADENISVSSAAHTPCSIEERSIIRASNKPAHLKRVSFGSNKGGSMVETLIYENTPTEEDPSRSLASTSTTTTATAAETSAAAAANFNVTGSNIGWNKNGNKSKAQHLRSVTGHHHHHSFAEEETQPLLSSSSESARSASKVRVTYFESKRPLTLPSPEASDAEWDDVMMAADQPSHHQQNYIRQISTESGQDNPFRPDGDLSREADELVELLKGGRPISEVLKSKEEVQRAEISGTELAASPGSRNASSPSSPKGMDTADGGGGRTNGNLTEQESSKRTSGASSPGAVEVQRAVVTPVAGAESQVEHVVIKKKSKCQCCVIQ